MTPRPIDPLRCALLLIDLQRDFLDPRGYAAQAGLDVERLRGVVAPALALLDAARGCAMKVIYTREGHRPDLSDCPGTKWARSRAAGAEIGTPGPLGRLLVRGEHGHDLIDELVPQDGELLIDKPGYSAFHQTDLDQILRVAAVDTLLVCGVTTEVCVHSTVRAAIDLGYQCITVSDACAASQPELQAPALAMIGVEGGIFGEVCDHASLLQRLPHGRWPIGALA
ncbi:MAG: isochorismatase family cysteine hydrolase [Hylemonella sp.]|nr:isochorismatase family cysteine hydrolase [Hylemonella sp.]